MAGQAELTSLAEHLASISSRLERLTDTPALDAQVLMAHVLGKERSWLAAHLEAGLDDAAVHSLERKVERLETGEPLPYVLGRWEFYGLAFEVNRDVLIPRPETELLVSQAMAWLRKRSREGEVTTVLDVGTGCGCIAISLAVNLKNIRVIASDISPEALEVARRNALSLKVDDRITFLQANLIPGGAGAECPDPPPETYDLVVANLPYIPSRKLAGLPVSKHEPQLALDGGEDGLRLIRRLIAEAPARLAPGGLILLEIEASQGAEAVSLAYDFFEEAKIHLHQDLAGHDRLLEIQLP